MLACSCALGYLIVAHGRLGLAVVEIEDVIIVVVTLDAVQVEENIVKLFQQEETG